MKKLTRIERRAYNKALWRCEVVKKELETVIKQIKSSDGETPFVQDVLKSCQALCELSALCVKNLKRKGIEND